MTASNLNRQPPSTNPHHSCYVGTYPDVHYDEGILTLPDDISRTLRERQPSVGKYGLIATIDKFEGDFKALRFRDVESPVKELSKYKYIYRIRSQISESNEIQLIIPHQVADKALLHSRVYLAASDDGETFTAWPYDTYFRAIGSKC